MITACLFFHVFILRQYFHVILVRPAASVIVSVPDKQRRVPPPIPAVVSPLHSLAISTIWLQSCLDLIQHSTGYYRQTPSFSQPSER